MKQTAEQIKIGFLGAGRMAQALAGGFVGSGLAQASDLVTFDPSSDAIEAFRAAVGAEANTADSLAGVTQSADVVFLAVKPAYCEQVLQEAASGWGQGKLLVSIAAGVSLETLQGALPEGAAVIRVMPNTPCLVGRGACCYATGTNATAQHAQIVGELLGSVGYAAEVTEQLLDAVTGLSGSGPAYVYTFIEALADGGVKAGLTRDMAAQLAAHTVAGAAEMVLSTGEHPAKLRDMVASPGGTTITGLAELERHGLRSAVIEAVIASANRSKELG